MRSTAPNSEADRTRRFVRVAGVFAATLVWLGTAAPVRAKTFDGERGRFGRPEPVEIVGLPQGAGGTPLGTEEPFVSRDGRFLFFNSGKLEGNKDLHHAEWREDRWHYAGEIGPGINTRGEVQGNPSLDAAGNFYFVASDTETMIRVGRFEADSGRVVGVRDVTGVPRKRVRPFRHTFTGNMGVEVASDGGMLFFSRATWDLKGLSLGTIAGSDLLLAIRSGEGFVYDADEARRILARVNTADLEYAASITADGLTLYFTRLPRAALEAKKIRSQILRATRSSLEAAFGEPEVIEAIGSADFVEGPAVTPDGRTLYYHKRTGHKFRLFRVTREGP